MLPRNKRTNRDHKGAPIMRKSTMLALALASTTLAATPAAANYGQCRLCRIRSGLWSNNTDVDIEYDYFGFDYSYDFEWSTIWLRRRHHWRYDFGQIRAELELGYKTAVSTKSISVHGDN